MTTYNEPIDTASLQLAFASAQGHFAVASLDEAAAICLRILARAPAHVETLHLLGLIRHQKGQSEEAVEYLQRAIELKPDYSAAHTTLGNALHRVGQLEEAERIYRTAIRCGPKNVQAHVSLGNLLRQLRRPNEAVASFTAALSITPDSATIHHFLGNAYRQLGRLGDTLACYKKALELQPTHSGTRFDLGLTLKNEGRLEEAIKAFEQADTPMSRPLILECLLRLRRYDEFFATLETHRSIDRANLRTSAISAYASQQLGRDDPHPFCPDPLGHIRVVNDLVGADGTEAFLLQLLAEVNARPAVYEPGGVTTYGGYQTGGNLFAHPSGALARLNQVFREQVVKYYRDIESEQSIFVQERPKDLKLRGWYVRYLSSGYQGGHIHADGWLTCVIYLSMPKKVSHASEGGIVFTLKDDNYPDIQQDVPNLLHVPVNGQIVLFPSTLYHYTIPVTSGEERLMIASDLLPAQSFSASIAS